MTDISQTQIIALGFGTDDGDIGLLEDSIANENPRIRQLAISALVRRNPEYAFNKWTVLSKDVDWNVRRRVCELGINIGHQCIPVLIELMNDSQPLVQEMACFAVGEILENAGEQETSPQTDEAIEWLIKNASHDDPLVRESSIASLGNIGDLRALNAVLKACTDKAPIRRRAIVALSAFTGKEVDEALDTALEDVDWQVRQAAEDISGKKSPKE